MATASSPKTSSAMPAAPKKPVATKAVEKKAVAKKAVEKKAVEKKAVAKKAVEKKAVPIAAASNAAPAEGTVTPKKPATSKSAGAASAGDEKAALWAALLAHMETSLAEMVSAARATHEAATHPESRPENDKDTRGVELSYLAAGQSARAMELQRAVSELRAIKLRSFDDAPIAVTALVRLRDEDNEVESLYLLAPASGGGPKLSYGGAPVAVVSPAAPLGKALVGRRTDDEFEVVLAGKKRVFAVVDVR